MLTPTKEFPVPKPTKSAPVLSPLKARSTSLLLGLALVWRSNDRKFTCTASPGTSGHNVMV